MKEILLATAVALALAACSRPQPAADIAPTATAETAAIAGAAPLPCAEPGYALLPKGITLEFPYHLRADRVYLDKQGNERRRVVLEFLDGDVESTLAAADASLVRSGFAARSRRNQPNGNIVVPYARKGTPGITVFGSSTVGPNPSNPAAKGTIALDYARMPVAPAAPPAPITPAEH